MTDAEKRNLALWIAKTGQPLNAATEQLLRGAVAK